MAAINGYKMQPFWIFIPLLKSSKIFVTNLLTIFILGILIYYKQLYESSKLFDFGKVKALLKIARCLILYHE